MKKISIVISNLFLVLFSTFLLCSCNESSSSSSSTTSLCEHNWGNEEVIYDATCIDDGTMKFTCIKCNETKTEVITKKGHFISDNLLFNDEGHYKICEICFEEFDFVKHNMKDDVIIKEVTSVDEGLMKTKCEDCFYTSTRVIEIIPHEKSLNYKHDDEYHWNVCSSHENCEFIINMEAHDYVEINRVNSTCTQKGVVTYRCSVCKTIKATELELAAHNYNSTYVNNLSEGHYRICECGEKEQVETHSMEDILLLEEATNGKDGLMKTKCEICGYNSTRVIKADEHSRGSEYYSNDTHHWLTCIAHINCNEKLDYEEHNYKEISRVDSTCDENGSITYRCNVCDKEKTEVLLAGHKLDGEFVNTDEQGHYHECVCGLKDEVIPHTFTTWSLTRKPTLYDDGEEVEACICGFKGIVTRVIKANADYTTDFNVETSDGLWKYGEINYTWGGGENFTFTPFETKLSGNDGWVKDGSEVKSSWMMLGNFVGIAYEIEKDINATVNINFVGGNDLTRVVIRIGIKNSSGVLIEAPSFHYDPDSKDNILTRNINFKAGDIVYFIFNNEANGVEGAHPYGNISINIKEKEEPLPEPNPNPNNSLDFVEGFSNEFSNGTWSYGMVNYSWSGGESFTFEPFSEKLSGNDGWISGENEIKAGWVKVDGTVCVAYLANETMTVNLKVKFIGDEESDRLAIRIGIKNESAELYEQPSFHFDSKSNINEIIKEITLNKNDVVYVMLFQEQGTKPTGAFTMTLENIEK